MQTTIKTAKPALRLMFGDRELTPQEASRLLRERINALRIKRVRVAEMWGVL